jgi:peptidoglycan/LPS O-acetylase OafA/YrhL
MRSKLGYVEGMRGCAALMVVAHHCGQMFLPALFWPTWHQWGVGEIEIATSPANILINGQFAVCLFFVLSGYVLSRRFMEDGDLGRLWSASIKRYPRLMLPVLASLLLAWTALMTGSYHVSEVAPVTGTWLSDPGTDPRSLLSVVDQSAFGVFFRGDYRLNGVLWTIQTEFCGSFLVFALAAVFGRSRWRLLGYCAAMLACWGSYYMAFPIGLAIAAVAARGGDRPRLAVVLAVIGLWLGSYPPYSAWKGIWIWPAMVFGPDARHISHILGAACLLQAVIMSPAKHWFDHRVFRFLGRISFSLYLIHWTILASLTCWLVLRLEPLFGYLPAIGIAFAVTMPVTLAASYVFCRLIDEPSTRLADRFARRVVGLASTLVRHRAVAPAE